MTAPGGVIATVYVDVLPTVRDFSRQLRRQLRQSTRELRTIDRELAPVTRGLADIGKVATGIVPGVRLARASLVSLGSHAVVGGLLSAAGAAATLSGALGAVPAVGAATASVMGALTVGLFGVDAALKKFADEEKFNAKLELLSEGAQKALGVINEFRDELTEFRDAVQDRLFAGLDEVARGLLDTFLPRLTTHFGNLVDVINLGVKDLAAFVQTAETLSDIDEITSNTEIAFSMFRQSLIPAATALRDVVTVGSRFLPLIAFEVNNIVIQFSEWIQVMRATGELQERIGRGLEALRQVGRIVGNLGEIISGVLGAARESGNGFLDTLEQLTEKLSDVVNSVRGQEAIGRFLDSARDAGAAILPVLVALGDLIFNHVLPALNDVGEIVGPAVAEFFSGLSEAIDQAGPGIRAFAAGFAAFVQGLIPALPALAEVVNSLGKLIGILASRLGPIIADVATAVGNVLVPILDVLSLVFTFLGDGILRFVVVIGSVVAIMAVLVSAVRGVLTVIGLFAAATKILSDSLLKTQGAATGIVGFLSGPWGIALGLAVTALGLFLSTSEGASEQQIALKNAAADLNDVIREQNGVLNENVRIKAAEQLEEQGALKLADQLGIRTQDVTKAYVEQGSALEGLRERLMQIRDANTTVTTDAEGVTNVIYNDQANAAVALLGILDQLSGGRRADAEATERQTAATLGAINPTTAWAAAIDGARFAIEALISVQQQQQLQQVEAINSELAYANQLARTTAELAEGNKTLDINTQEGRDNLGSITQLVSAGITRINDLQKQGVATAEVTAQTNAMREQLIGMVQPFFSSREAAVRYLETLGLIPDQITTQVYLNISNVLTAAQQAAAAIRNIPGALFGVGQRAHGGPVRAGEWTIVGENGPELVRWGRSARVFSTDDSERMATDVGTLDDMTARGTGSTTSGAATGALGSSITVDNQIDVQPTVRVYVDGQELMGNVRVELDARDRQLRRLVTTNVGGRR